MKKRVKRARLVEEAVRLAYSSLKSHLPYASERKGFGVIAKEGARFHQKAAREYAKIILNLTKLY